MTKNLITENIESRDVEKGSLLILILVYEGNPQRTEREASVLRAHPQEMGLDMGDRETARFFFFKLTNTL